MGYELLYEMQTIKRKRLDRRNEKTKVLIDILSMVLLIVFVYGLASFVQMKLLRQTNAATAAAEQMITELKTGSDLKEAVNVFCSEILK